MTLRLAIADDTFARRWLEGTFVRACIHNVTGEVMSIAIKGTAPMNGAALFDNRTALTDLINYDSNIAPISRSLKNRIATCVPSGSPAHSPPAPAAPRGSFPQ
jgi:hypothetical protein